MEPIARAQIACEDAAAARAEGRGCTLVVRDTDLVSTVVYARHYYGACPPWIVDAASRRRADLYLLCDVDVAWEADEQRDRPHARAGLRDAFARTLDSLDCRWLLIRGLGDARVHAVLAAVATMFDPPLAPSY